MAWVETTSARFSARHDDREAADAAQVLRTLDGVVDRFEDALGTPAGDLTLVLHGNEAQLDAAAPTVPVLRRMTHPAGRRYVVGWAGEDELHVLSPRALARRATNAEGSLELLMLTPVSLLARNLLASALPGMPPPWTARAWPRYLRWAWLLEGAAQWMSGGVPHVRPVVARRLREGPEPAFPPARADALLLGGTLFDLVTREDGPDAALELALTAPQRGARAAIERAFDGRDLRHTEAAWRSFVARDR